MGPVHTTSLGNAANTYLCRWTATIGNCSTTRDSLLQRVRRSILQSYKWSCCMMLEELETNLTDWRWSMDDIGELRPIWTTLPKAHKELKNCSFKSFGPVTRLYAKLTIFHVQSSMFQQHFFKDFGYFLATRTICQKDPIRKLDLGYRSIIPFFCFLRYTSAQNFKLLVQFTQSRHFCLLWPFTIRNFVHFRKKKHDSPGCMFLSYHVRVLEWIYTIVAWMSRNSLLETLAISEVTVTGFEPTTA